MIATVDQCCCTVGCDHCSTTATVTQKEEYIVTSTCYPEFDYPVEPIEVDNNFEVPGKKVNQLKGRMNVKIHKPAGGWGMGRF